MTLPGILTVCDQNWKRAAFPAERSGGLGGVSFFHGTSVKRHQPNKVLNDN